jgi:hypothetical protein
MMTMDKGTVQTGGKGTDYKGTDYKGTDYKGTDYKGTDYKGTVQTGGAQTLQTGALYKGTGGKHRHSRKYYKRGGVLNYSAVENLVHQATTAPMFNSVSSIQTNMQPPAYV